MAYFNLQKITYKIQKIRRYTTGTVGYYRPVAREIIQQYFTQPVFMLTDQKKMLGLVYYKPSFYIERYENPFNKYYMHCIISVKGMSESCINTLEPIIVALKVTRQQ